MTKQATLDGALGNTLNGLLKTVRSDEAKKMDTVPLLNCCEFETYFTVDRHFFLVAWTSIPME